MFIHRALTERLVEKIRNPKGKAVILYGPRQVGKTTLCRTIIDRLGYRTLSINADERRFPELESRDRRQLLGLTKGYDLLFIDEAQRIPNIGLNLKILVDHAKGLRILATGSSSFELANTVAEPLTGRKWTYTLYPIAQLELAHHMNHAELRDQLEERLVWGSYPELFHLTGHDERRSYLAELAADYLYRDLLALQDIRNPSMLRSLLKLLAFQIGSEVSITELASSLTVSKETVARYLDLLEQAFVLFRLSGFQRNLRKEVTKQHKFYFWDLGIRNAIIDNCKPIADRNDHGALWENFCIMERVKRNAYTRQHASPYFWRTYAKAEIDYVEEGMGGALAGFECSWSPTARKREPPSWRAQYPHATWETVTREHWIPFVGGDAATYGAYSKSPPSS